MFREWLAFNEIYITPGSLKYSLIEKLIIPTVPKKMISEFHLFLLYSLIKNHISALILINLK